MDQIHCFIYEIENKKINCICLIENNLLVERNPQKLSLDHMFIFRKLIKTNSSLELKFMDEVKFQEMQFKL